MTDALPTISTAASEACTTTLCYLFTPLPHTENIFAYKGSVSFHLKFFVIMVFVFFALYFVAFSFLSKVWKPEFFVKQPSERAQWRVAIYMVVMFHHTTIALTACYTIFVMPPQSPPLRLLYSPIEANMDYYPINTIAGTFSVAYMLFDLTTQTLWLNDFSKLGKQHIVHHIIATYIIVMCALSGEHMPKLVHVAFICETSGVFLHIREIKGKDSWTGTFAFLNSLGLLLSFTFFRVIIFLLCIISHWKMASVYDFAGSSAFHKFSYYSTLTLFMVIYGLNLFWYQLIVKSAYRKILGNKQGDKF